MTFDEVASHPVFKENNGAAVCNLLVDVLLTMQREVTKTVPHDGFDSDAERLAEIGRRVIIYDEQITAMQKLADPKLTTTAKPKRKRLHNEPFKDA